MHFDIKSLLNPSYDAITSSPNNLPFHKMRLNGIRRQWALGEGEVNALKFEWKMDNPRDERSRNKFAKLASNLHELRLQKEIAFSNELLSIKLEKI